MVAGDLRDVRDRLLVRRTPGRDIVEIGNAGDEASVAFAIDERPVPHFVHRTLPLPSKGCEATAAKATLRRADRCVRIVSARLPARLAALSRLSARLSGLETRHPSGVLRQLVVDLPPGRLGRGEDVQPRPHAWIVVEQPGRDAHGRKIGRLSRHQRAADPAEGAEAAGCGFVALDQGLAGEPAELRLLDMGIGGEACAGELAAGGAMAVGHRSHRIDLETNAAAGAAAFDHLPLLLNQPGVTDMAPNLRDRIANAPLALVI